MLLILVLQNLNFHLLSHQLSVLMFTNYVFHMASSRRAKGKNFFDNKYTRGCTNFLQFLHCMFLRKHGIIYRICGKNDLQFHNVKINTPCSRGTVVSIDYCRCTYGYLETRLWENNLSRLCRVWLGIGEGANVILGKSFD